VLGEVETEGQTEESEKAGETERNVKEKKTLGLCSGWSLSVCCSHRSHGEPSPPGTASGGANAGLAFWAATAAQGKPNSEASG